MKNALQLSADMGLRGWCLVVWAVLKILILELENQIFLPIIDVSKLKSRRAYGYLGPSSTIEEHHRTETLAGI